MQPGLVRRPGLRSRRPRRTTSGGAATRSTRPTWSRPCRSASGWRSSAAAAGRRRCLHKAFPHVRTGRAQAHAPLDYLRTLRSRIAYHDPILTRHLAADYRSLLTVTGWISPGTRDWIDHHSRVEQLLELPRDAGAVS